MGCEFVRPISRHGGFATLPSQNSRANTPHRGGGMDTGPQNGLMDHDLIRFALKIFKMMF